MKITNDNEEWRSPERERLRIVSGNLQRSNDAPHLTVGSEPSFERTAPVLSGLVAGLGLIFTH